MKTTSYNPSAIEIDFAKAIVALRGTLSDQLSHNEITSIDMITDDNPRLLIHLKDSDGDVHELVVKVIQRQDK